MCFGPAAGVRLVGTLPLFRSRHLFLETLRVRARPRAQDQTSIVNKKSQIPKRKSRIPRRHAAGGQGPAAAFRDFFEVSDLDLGLGISGCYSRESWLVGSGRPTTAKASVSSPSFPQLWKTLWKIQDYRTARLGNVRFYRVFAQAKPPGVRSDRPSRRSQQRN